MQTVERVVVDSNVLFSALLKPQSRFAQTLLSLRYEFHIADLVLVELFKHEERILAGSRLSQDRLTAVFQSYIHRLHVYNINLLPPEHRREALRLCYGVDETDAPHVAVALTLGAPLWTGDRVLRRGLEQRGFTSFFDPPPPSE